MQQMDAAQQNIVNRQITLQTAIPMQKMLPPVNASAGGQNVQIKLERMGITTGITLDVTVPVTIATATATQSDFGPWNIFQRIRYTDFSGTDRINTSGWGLWALQALKYAGNSAGLPVPFTGVAGLGSIDTDLYRYPTAVGTSSIRFQLYVPLAYNPENDLRGAILTQALVSDHYLTLTIPALTGADTYVYPYAAGNNVTSAANSIVIQPIQHYLQPQSGTENLPVFDLSTVYSIEGNLTTTAGIVANQSLYRNYPNNRSVYSLLTLFENGNAGTLNGTDISKVSLIANSNTTLREWNPAVLRASMRAKVGADIAKGAYFIESRGQPILTQQLGNVQAKFDIATVAGSGVVAFIDQFESFYPSGASLPGVGGM